MSDYSADFRPVYALFREFEGVSLSILQNKENPGVFDLIWRLTRVPTFTVHTGQIEIEKVITYLNRHYYESTPQNYDYANKYINDIEEQLSRKLVRWKRAEFLRKIGEN